MAIGRGFTPAYQKAPDMSRVNRKMLEYSDRELLLPVYDQALMAVPELKTVGVHHQPIHEPGGKHLYGAMPSFRDGRHAVYVPLHGQGLESAEQIRLRCPIVNEVSDIWHDPMTSESQRVLAAEAGAFSYELGRASLQVAFNGRPNDYLEFINKGIDDLPFRHCPPHQIDSSPVMYYVAHNRAFLRDTFGTSEWDALVEMQYNGYRQLPREQYLENFVAYVALQLKGSPPSSKPEALGFA